MRIYKFAVFALTWPQKSRKRLVLLVRSSCFLKVGEASRRTALLCVGGGHSLTRTLWLRWVVPLGMFVGADLIAGLPSGD